MILRKISNTNFINRSSKFNAAFVGLTHLGLVFSICSASFLKRVLAIDENKKIISKLDTGVLETPEPGLNTLIKRNKTRLHFSCDFQLLSDVALVFISLDTPTDKPFSLKNLNSLISKVIPHLSENSVLIITSQVPVGFCRKLRKQIIKKRPDLKFELCYFLNTLVIGDSVNRFLKPERIVLGFENSLNTIQPDLLDYLKQFSTPVLKMSYESAELTKSAINLFLASSIITTNTVADFCEAVGANFNEILPALKSDKRIGPFAYLRPTLRISGGHLERELVKLKALSKQYQISSGIVDPLINLNNKRINWLTQKINQLSKEKSIKTITLWGLSYKKDAASTDNASSIEIIRSLSKRFIFQVYDPKAIMPRRITGYKRFKDKYSALKNSDCLIILTAWDEFKKVNIFRVNRFLKDKEIIDCVGILYSSRKKFKQLEYLVLGAGNL